jgi:hypothetical protein
LGISYPGKKKYWLKVLSKRPPTARRLDRKKKESIISYMWLIVKSEDGERRFSLNSQNIVRLQIKHTSSEEDILWADTVDNKGCIITRGSKSWCERYFDQIMEEKENPGILEIPEREKKKAETDAGGRTELG